MAKYIDLDDDEIIYCGNDGEYERYNIPTDVPTADVVEVVRCKECIHNRDIETSFGSKFHICNLSKLVFTQYSDFYCAYGEREKDG